MTKTKIKRSKTKMGMSTKGSLIDITQRKKQLSSPVYRVWVKNPSGDDYWYEYKTENEAKQRLPVIKKMASSKGEKVQGTFVAHKGREWSLTSWKKYNKK